MRIRIRDQGSCKPWVWDPGWQKLDPGYWIQDVYPGSWMQDVYPGSWMWDVQPGSATLILTQKILNNAIVKCEDLIKKI